MSSARSSKTSKQTNNTPSTAAVLRVVGTAGHVDHGKSTLVQRLTGIDPDRLAEEKARAMTIDLGFAWMTLADGTQLGLVDVPGHRDFIANMLAGVGGIDAALLVVAADEGVMPQTREHLAILDLLDVHTAVVALTKTDLIDDVDWLTLVEQEVRDTLTDSALANAPIVPVSAATGDGLDALIATLTDQLRALPERREVGTPRLPIDRVFSMSGFGTVVTGTLAGGSLRSGDEVELQPSGERARIRGLQCYEQQVTVAYPGSRVAINLSGVERADVRRGDVLTLPGRLKPTTLVDVHFRHLADANRALRHNAAVKLFSGTTEVNAHVRLLSHEILPPGAKGWLQLRLDQPAALSMGDRFILRIPSPAQTIGGGVIVDAHPARRHKRMNAEVLAALDVRLIGSPGERLAQLAPGPEPVKRGHLMQAAGLTLGAFATAVESALADGHLVELRDGALLSATAWEGSLRRIETTLAHDHEAHPLRRGMSREALRSRLGVKQATLTLYLDALPTVVVEDALVRLASHEVVFRGPDADSATRLRAALANTPYTPPSFNEAVTLAGEDVVYALIDLGEIIRINNELIFGRSAYDEMVAGVLTLIDTNGGLAANVFRDYFATTRKYAIGLLEHLDALGITERNGDVRVRGPRPGSS